MKLQKNKIRNIGLVAHIDAGKTTTTERILYYTGRTHRMGDVDDGTTITDWMIQEKERGITITSAATYCKWKDCNINIIDTPGHIDFTIEVERSLRVLDGCIIIFDAVNGVEAQSETVWRQSDKYKVSRIIFVNKMDRPNADFFDTVKQVEKRLSAIPLVIQLPYFEAGKFLGVIDLIDKKLYLWETEDKNNREYKIMNIPDTYEKTVREYREKILELLSEFDDNFMQKYVHSQDITANDIKSVIRKATILSKYFPVFCGSAFKNKGIQLLLDGIVDYLPSPVDLPPVEGKNPNTLKSEIRFSEDEEPLSALAFKIQTDSFVNKLTYIRIYSGKIAIGNSVYNSCKQKFERISRILRMHANNREEIKEAFAGDIVGIIGFRNTSTGDTLCDRKYPIILESINYPEPVLWIAIEPKTTQDQEKLSLALRKMTEEDPTFKVSYNEETNQTIISGMGELHLDIIVDRIKREFGVMINTSKPQVAYRETIKTKVIEEGRYIKQTGGKGQYGHVWLEIEPFNDGFKFINKIKGGIIPKDYIPAIEQGIKESMLSGPLNGFPLVNIQVSLIDGSYHEVDSSDIAYKLASSIALRNGVKKADPVLLEPFMKIQTITPEEFLGDVLGDLNKRRCKIEEMNPKNNLYYITGMVPLSEMFGYATVLRSLTQGRGTYIMEPSHYEEVPKEIMEEILAIKTK